MIQLLYLTLAVIDTLEERGISDDKMSKELWRLMLDILSRLRDKPNVTEADCHYVQEAILGIRDYIEEEGLSCDETLNEIGFLRAQLNIMEYNYNNGIHDKVALGKLITDNYAYLTELAFNPNVTEETAAATRRAVANLWMFIDALEQNAGL